LQKDVFQPASGFDNPQMNDLEIIHISLSIKQIQDSNIPFILLSSQWFSADIRRYALSIHRIVCTGKLKKRRLHCLRRKNS